VRPAFRGLGIGWQMRDARELFWLAQKRAWSCELIYSSMLTLQNGTNRRRAL
jgi:hypothetical protein